MGKKLMRKALALLAAVCMIVSMSLTAFAAEEDTNSTAAGVTGTTEDPTDGILQVWLAYEADNGNRTLLSGGTCFLINEEYVLSNYHIFDLGFRCRKRKDSARCGGTAAGHRKSGGQ